MPISYSKLLKLFDEKNITSYTLTKKDRIIGQKTLTSIQEGGDINTKTIAILCEYLHCQPGDILEYVPDKVDD